jgi:hemoglobin-like flavoprotein
MTAHEMLSENFHLILEREPKLTERLYEELFRRHPETEELFGEHSFATRRQMLSETLVGVLDVVAKESWVASNLNVLGCRHDSYEVGREMYDWWRDCLVELLADVSGEDWSDELERLWSDGIDALGAQMINARADALGAGLQASG